MTAEMLKATPQAEAGVLTSDGEAGAC